MSFQCFSLHKVIIRFFTLNSVANYKSSERSFLYEYVTSIAKCQIVVRINSEKRNFVTSHPNLLLPHNFYPPVIFGDLKRKECRWGRKGISKPGPLFSGGLQVCGEINI